MTHTKHARVCVLIGLLLWLPNPFKSDYLRLCAQTKNQYKPYHKGIPEGWKIIQGDILVPIVSPQGVFATNFWPGGIVPFEFDTNVSTTNQTLMQNAMAEWQAVADIQFVVRNNEANYLHIQNATENSSAVGMQKGQQVVNIHDWNVRFIMVHELGHALGLWHEQSRPDRDDYIQINWNNIQDDLEHNFNKESSADVYPKQAYGLSDERTYDFDSIMHYGECDFSIDCPAGFACNCTNTTITVLLPNQAWQNRIGQRNHLSDLDELTMSFLYPENNWYFVDWTFSGYGTGKFLDPFADFWFAYLVAPFESVLWIQPGSYSAVGTYVKPLTLMAPLGNVTLGK